ncbi:hypothetical protein GOODEAATRI_013554, partial [Goodea atripinnis]
SLFFPLFRRIRIKICTENEKIWFHWGSNPGPSACKADVITATLWNHIDTEPLKTGIWIWIGSVYDVPAETF